MVYTHGHGQDRLERLAAKGIKPEDAATVAKVEKPADPYKERKLALSSKLRDIIGFHRNDPTTPNPGTKALETAVSCPPIGMLYKKRARARIYIWNTSGASIPMRPAQVCNPITLEAKLKAAWIRAFTAPPESET